MDRRRSLLKIAALRSEREQQVGVNCTKGYLGSTDAGLLFDGPRSMECFFNLRQSDGTQRPVQFSTSMLAIAVTPMDAIMFHCGDKSLQVSRVTIGDDIHAVISYDGATAMCYINGIEVGAMQPTAYTPSALFRIGDPLHITKSPVHFCRHFNYALSAEEVVALYNDGDPAGYILPRNLKNIKDMAFTSKTFEFDMDSPYYQRVLESGELESGRKYRVDYVVEEWDIAPAVIGSCGISCGVLSTVGTQYWPNLSAAKLGENQHVVVDTKETGTPYMFVYASTPSDTYTSRRLKVTVHSVKMLGCVAEYLPQNLVGSPHGDPVVITGENSYTWAGADSDQYHIVIAKPMEEGKFYKVNVTVSDYQSGRPSIYCGRSYLIPAQNGTYDIIIYPLRPYIDSVIIYGGNRNDPDRYLTLTVNTVTPVGGIALSWLDSAKQRPLNDEYLPPLLQSDGGYDLTASGTPEIIIK